MGKDTTRVTFESREEEFITNENTGEVKSSVKRHTQHIRYSKEPSYVKLYLDHLSRFKGLQLSFNPILAELLKSTTYANLNDQDGGMLLFLNKPLKEIIAQRCGVSLGRVDNAVTEFVKKGYMRRLKLGMYQFNPFFFGKGEWKDIENIRAMFDYGTGEAVAEIVRTEEAAMNKASDEIAEQSKEQLAAIQKDN